MSRGTPLSRREAARSIIPFLGVAGNDPRFSLRSGRGKDHGRRTVAGHPVRRQDQRTGTEEVDAQEGVEGAGRIVGARRDADVEGALDLAGPEADTLHDARRRRARQSVGRARGLLDARR